MQLNNIYRLEPQQMLSGLFRTDRDVYQAREILTDFGYPREAANVVVLSKISKEIKDYGKSVAKRVKGKLSWGFAIWAAIVILIGSLAAMRYYPEVTQSEVVLLITVWALVVAICTVACGFIGALAAALISSVVAREYSIQSEEVFPDQRILISVAVRNLSDAHDIAQEWEQIGGQVVQMPDAHKPDVHRTEPLAA